MQSLKYKDLKGQKAVLHCQTRDEFNEVSSILGYEWQVDNNWFLYREDTFVYVDVMAFCNRINIARDAVVYPAADFIAANTKPVAVPPLPEKWYIERNQDNYEKVNEWANGVRYQHFIYLVSDKGAINYYGSDEKRHCFPITTAQFIENVYNPWKKGQGKKEVTVINTSEINVHENSHAFIHFLESENVTYKANGHFTTLIGVDDVFGLAFKWGKYYEKNAPKFIFNITPPLPNRVPFTWDAYKPGMRVETRDGREVKDFGEAGIEVPDYHGGEPYVERFLAGKIKDKVVGWGLNGKYLKGQDSPLDLFIISDSGVKK